MTAPRVAQGLRQKMAARFRNPIMKDVYVAMLAAYRERAGMLFTPEGRRRLGTGHAATTFWRGFDGLAGPTWDAHSRRTPSYACFRAGQDAAAYEAAGCYRREA